MRCDAAHSTHTDDLALGPFCVSFALGEDGRFDEYRLRYEVFVEEYHLEPPCVTRLERDEFDPACCAFVLRDAASGEVAASQRLILPDRLPPGLLTNFEREYRRDPECVNVDLAALARDSWAEASRTTVAPRYRWGAAGRKMPAMVAIKYASLALAIAFGRSTLFSLSEPATARLIRRLGFPMVRVGAAVEFHGPRAPFRMDMVAIARSVAPDRWPELNRLIGAACRLAGGPRTGDQDPPRAA